MVKLPDTSTFHEKLIVCEVITIVWIGVNVLLSVVYDTVTFAPVINGDRLTVMFTLWPFANVAGEVDIVTVLFPLYTNNGSGVEYVWSLDSVRVLCSSPGQASKWRCTLRSESRLLA